MRIVSITMQYVVGKGVIIEGEKDPENKFLQDFWNHPLNYKNTRLREEGLVDDAEVLRVVYQFMGEER